MASQGEQKDQNSRKIGFLFISLIVIISLPFFFSGQRITGEVWRYRSADTSKDYLLLSNVSRYNSVFGPTQKISRRNIDDVKNHISGGRDYDVYIKNVASLTKPEDKEYRWVAVDEVVHAVMQAGDCGSCDDIVVKAADGQSTLLDRKLLMALINDYKRPDKNSPVLIVENKVEESSIKPKLAE